MKLIMDLRNGDCLELMKSIPDKSVDLLICDLPYGETNCKWDTKIDMEEFWKEFKRIRKSPRVACIHFCSTKFGHSLIKSWEKGFKMDMVWKKRNKTGGLQSRYRPMRNHEMVYFFYDQAPKYNRDKYHKRIQAVKKHEVEKEGGEKVYGTKSSKFNKNEKYFEPPNPASVVEENPLCYKMKKFKDGGHCGRLNKDGSYKMGYEPPNPSSVLEEEEKFCKEYYETNKTGMTKTDIYSKENIKKFQKENGIGFEPPNPSSVLEEEKDFCYGNGNYLKAKGNTQGTNNFEPPNPASVLENETDIYGETKEERKKRRECDCNYEPPNPSSVFDSDKVFIGKRNHQTEKPQDILEFFLKYWTDENDVVLDPTMGSGSTGVACKKLKRKFIGFELDPKIYEVANKRINKIDLKTEPKKNKKKTKKI